MLYEALHYQSRNLDFYTLFQNLYNLHPSTTGILSFSKSFFFFNLTRFPDTQVEMNTLSVKPISMSGVAVGTTVKQSNGHSLLLIYRSAERLAAALLQAVC